MRRTPPTARRLHLLLATSSVAALLVGDGAPPALACNTGPFPQINTGATSCIVVNNTSFSGNLVNSGTGTISPGPTGINVENSSTITGQISNAGTISVSGTGILIQSNAVVTGGITSSGTISAGGAGMEVGGNITFPSLTFSASSSAAISSFSGGITNSGTISAGVAGIEVGGNVTGEPLAGGNSASVNISTFSGGIANSGTISVSGTTFTGSAGIEVGGYVFNPDTNNSTSLTISTFSGGITNSGTIFAHGMTAATGVGIVVGGFVYTAGVHDKGSITISIFSGGITNSGTISAGDAGIEVGGQALTNIGADDSAIVTISTFSGGITNSGTISARGAGIEVGGSVRPAGGAATTASVTVATFLGGITNSGTISAAGAGILVGGTANTGLLADGGQGSVTVSIFSGGITNSGTITSGGAGIEVGGTVTSATGAANTGAVTISTFSGGIANSGMISAGGAGIEVGGNASVNTAAGTTASVTIATFSGGITNSGTITAGGTGIFVGGDAGSSTVLDTDYRASVTVATFFGGITNSGTISAAGAGIWVGGNASIHGGITNGAHVTIGTFSGGISNSGTVSVGGNGIWVGGNAAVSNGGITNAASVTIATFIGGIANSGTITAGGAGIFVGGSESLSGVGGISNSANVTIATFSGGISNSGTIIANTGILLNNVSTFSGEIANSGTISGVTGIVVFNSAPVSIFDSSVIIGTAGTAVDLSGNAAGNTFTLGPGYSITGNVLGQGSDTFQLGGSGAGAFDLSTVGTQYTGFTTFNVVSGVWAVSNVFGQAQAWNVLGGTLAGTGTLPAVNVNSGGALAPGAIGAPGTAMTITGNLAFVSSANYLATVGGSLASFANVGGTATLTGGTVQASFTSGATRRTYDILHTGGLGGTSFAGAVSLDPNYAVSLTDTATDVYLNLTAQLGNGSGLNPNQQNVANVLNNNFNNGGSLPSSLIPLFTLTGADLGNSLSQLTGEVSTGAETSAFQLMTEFLNLMLDPFVNGRSFAPGGAGGAIGFAPDRQEKLPPEIAQAYAAVFKAPPRKVSFDQRWGAWGTAYGGGNTAQGGAAVGSNTVNASTFGVAAGMDYRVSPHTIVGFALAGGGTNWDLANALGTGRSDALQVGAYGITRFGPAYLTGALAFTNNWFTTDRSALGDQITANFAGQSYGARLEGGYRMPVRDMLGVTPYAAVQAQDFSTPNYSETDKTGGGLGLSFAAMNATDVRTELGARFDDPTLYYGKPLILFGQLAWAHDFVKNPALSAAFEALPGSSFTVSGAPIPHDSAITSAGAQYFLSSNWSVSAKFYGNFASSSQTYAGTGALRYAW